MALAHRPGSGSGLMGYTASGTAPISQESMEGAEDDLRCGTAHPVIWPVGVWPRSARRSPGEFSIDQHRHGHANVGAAIARSTEPPSPSSPSVTWGMTDDATRAQHGRRWCLRGAPEEHLGDLPIGRDAACTPRSAAGTILTRFLHGKRRRWWPTSARYPCLPKWCPNGEDPPPPVSVRGVDQRGPPGGSPRWRPARGRGLGEAGLTGGLLGVMLRSTWRRCAEGGAGMGVQVSVDRRVVDLRPSSRPTEGYTGGRGQGGAQSRIRSGREDSICHNSSARCWVATWRRARASHPGSFLGGLAG
jgi:hypothetical protein